MDSGLLRKHVKAKQYAEERDRIHVEAVKVRFDGTNNNHNVEFKDGVWNCDCDFFIGRGTCSHTMAMEIILKDMLAAPVA